MIPNSGDGWWIYKCYLPTTPMAMRQWKRRKDLLQKTLLSASADVVCVQEASEVSAIDDDFDFMLEAGYKFAVAKKGRMRCVTFWRDSILELVGAYELNEVFKIKRCHVYTLSLSVAHTFTPSLSRSL